MKKFFALACVLTLMAASAHAANVSIVWSGDPGNSAGTPSAEAIAAGVPADTLIFEAWVTTDADILSVGNVLIDADGDLFQVAPPFGSNTAPPDPAFVGLNRALEADSWITTPGSTSLLGTDMPGDGTGTWGDLTNDGAQTDFMFARLSVPAGTTGTFTGRITVAGATGPENFPFELKFVPEPATFVLAGMGLLGLVAARRRMA